MTLKLEIEIRENENATKLRGKCKMHDYFVMIGAIEQIKQDIIKIINEHRIKQEKKNG